MLYLNINIKCKYSDQFTINPIFYIVLKSTVFLFFFYMFFFCLFFVFDVLRLFWMFLFISIAFFVCLFVFSYTSSFTLVVTLGFTVYIYNTTSQAYVSEISFKVVFCLTSFIILIKRVKLVILFLKWVAQYFNAFLFFYCLSLCLYSVCALTSCCGLLYFPRWLTLIPTRLYL